MSGVQNLIMRELVGRQFWLIGLGAPWALPVWKLMHFNSEINSGIILFIISFPLISQFFHFGIPIRHLVSSEMILLLTTFSLNIFLVFVNCHFLFVCFTLQVIYSALSPSNFINSVFTFLVYKSSLFSECYLPFFKAALCSHKMPHLLSLKGDYSCLKFSSGSWCGLCFLPFSYFFVLLWSCKLHSLYLCLMIFGHPFIFKSDTER